MTDIEFKVQFMCESSGGKGGCKSTAAQAIEQGFGAGRGAGGTAGVDVSVGASAQRCWHTMSGAGGRWGPAVFATGMRVAAGCHRLCCEARQDVISSGGGSQ